jgi:hypothetical protein
MSKLNYAGNPPITFRFILHRHIMPMFY